MTKSKAAPVLAAFLVFLAVVFANNRNTASDPRATLLVSESILTRATIKLDDYGEEFLSRYGYAVHEKNGHFYYYFPIGTSIASVPIVAVSRAIGLNTATSEPAIQIVIAAITSVVSLLVLVKLASFFLSLANACLLSSVYWFGTAFASTGGTALWSHNLATLSALLTIYFLVRAAKLQEPKVWPLIAALLFAAYLCRPTMALLAPFSLAFFYAYFRAAAIKAGALLLSFLCVFALFSLHEFKQLLPDYYLPKRLAEGVIGDAIYGNLLSPSRGLLVYSPFIITAWACFAYSEKPWGLKKAWLLVGLAWPIAHLIFVSRFPHWWGGYSYGARFMMDALPGLFLLTLYTWPTDFRTSRSKILGVVLGASCCFAIVVNTGQGLFNKYALAWNGDPSVDAFPEYLFDWQYPQFFATKNGHSARLLRHSTTTIRAISPDEVVAHASGAVVFLGWSDAEAGHRWSSGNESTILFRVDDPKSFAGTLEIQAGALGSQRVTILLNDQHVYSGVISGWNGRIELNELGADIKKGVNSIKFQLPDARRAGNGDPRVLAIALKSLRIR